MLHRVMYPKKHSNVKTPIFISNEGSTVRRAAALVANRTTMMASMNYMALFAPTLAGTRL